MINNFEAPILLYLLKQPTIFSSSISKEIQAWPSEVEKPSDLYRIVTLNNQHPPLMQSKSWNLAVPYKEQRFFHTPSESIANNYTPSINQLKIRNLNQSIKANRRENTEFNRNFNRFNLNPIEYFVSIQFYLLVKLLSESRIKFNSTIELKRKKHSARESARQK